MKKFFALLFLTVMTIGLASCEADNTADDAYEIQGIDKDEVRSPDDRGED